MSDELDNYGILGTIFFLDGIPTDPSPDVQQDIDTLCGKSADCEPLSRSDQGSTVRDS